MQVPILSLDGFRYTCKEYTSMNTIIQQQTSAQQIAGVIRNFRKVATREGSPMAVFTIGTLPAKCFDFAVDTAEHWAETGKKVLVNGKFSNHNGQIEFVAQNISLIPPGQADTQDHAEITAADQAPIRESGSLVENLSGSVSDMRAKNTFKSTDDNLQGWRYTVQGFWGFRQRDSEG